MAGQRLILPFQRLENRNTAFRNNFTAGIIVIPGMNLKRPEP